MKYSIAVKIIALSGFLFFISVFVLYRAGKLDHYLMNVQPGLQTGPNVGVQSFNSDTSKLPKKDSLQKTMMPSSKVVILTDKKPGFIDSVRLKRKSDAERIQRRNLMGSSKSGRIFTPIEEPKADSQKFDTTKFKR